jgi:hypothetical protein
VVPRVAREFGGIRIETTEWPILVMDCPERRVPEAEFRASLDYIEQLMLECERSRQRCFQVTDLTRIQELPTASQRKYAGEWTTRTTELQKKTSIGGANVTPSAIVRGIITAIHWIQRPATPVAFFATRPEAMVHAVSMLEGASVLLPPALVELRDRLAPKLAGVAEKRAAAGRWFRRG